MRRILIIGGTSGLGLSLARRFLDGGDSVTITGRHDPNEPGIDFLPLDIGPSTEALRGSLHRLLEAVGTIDMCIYAAGFSQIGGIQELSDDDIITMNNVGLVAPALLIEKILKSQQALPVFIAITSTSQWIPREKEPMYAGVKAGLAHFVHSVATGKKIKKTLVVGPAGMDTKMQRERESVPNGTLLDPDRVARAIMEQLEDVYTYRLVRILRDPERIEILDSE